MELLKNSEACRGISCLMLEDRLTLDGPGKGPHSTTNALATRAFYPALDGCFTSYDNQSASLLEHTGQELIPPSLRGSFGLEFHNNSSVDSTYSGIHGSSFAPTYNAHQNTSITLPSYSEYPSSSTVVPSYNEHHSRSITEPSYSESHSISITETACNEHHNNSVTEQSSSETHNIGITEPTCYKHSCDSIIEPTYSNQYNSNIAEPNSTTEHNNRSILEPSYDERHTNRNTENIYHTNHNSDITEPACSEHQDASITEPSYCDRYKNSCPEPFYSESRDTTSTEPSYSEKDNESVTEPSHSEQQSKCFAETPYSEHQNSIKQTTYSEIQMEKNISRKENIDSTDKDSTEFCNNAAESQMILEKDKGGGIVCEVIAKQPDKEYGSTSNNLVQQDQTSGSETESLGDELQVHKPNNVMQIATCDTGSTTARCGTANSGIHDINVTSKAIIIKHRTTKQTKCKSARRTKCGGTKTVGNKKKAKKESQIPPVGNTVARQKLHRVGAKEKIKNTVKTSPAGPQPNQDRLGIPKNLPDSDITDSVVETQETSIKKISQGAKSKSDYTVKEIYCKDCEHLFLRRRNYDRHLQTDKCKHVCEFCGKVFLYGLTANYKMHLKYHNKQKDFECKICGEMFIERGKMLQHYDRHTVAKPVMCDQCGDTFARTSALSSHKSNMHNENKPKYHCTKCTRVLDSKSGLRYHMKHNHNTGYNLSFPCFICGKLFKERSLLKVHEAGHKETRDFKCDQCSATFKRTSGLATHKKRHAKDHRHFCGVCKKGFFSPMELHSHERTHTGERPYKCSLCDYRCAHRSNLYKHEKVHRKTL